MSDGPDSSLIWLAMLSVAVLLAFATRLRALSLHPPGREPSPAGGVLRPCVVGLLWGGAVAGAGWSSSVLLGTWIDPLLLAGLPLPELVAGASLAALILFFAQDPGPRIAPTLGAAVAASVPVLLFRAAGGLVAAAPPPPASLGLLAASAAALALASGRHTHRLRAARDAAIHAAGDGLMVVDTADRILSANAAVRKALRLDANDRAPGAPIPLPKGIGALLADPGGRRARLRSSVNHFFEAWASAAEPDSDARGWRGVLVRDITARRQDERRLLRLAHHDSLTGLANRRLLLETLPQVLDSTRAAEGRGALFYIDLDRFKVINDSLGHAAGDALLQTVAERLRHDLRSSALAPLGLTDANRIVTARIAGDEFAVVASRVETPQAAAELARLIIELIRRPMDLADRTLSCAGSVGYALFPDDADNVDVLIRNADAALYVAKSRGRNRAVRYESAFDSRGHRARRIEGELREAIKNGELRLNYQPKVELASGIVAGFEALLRWTSEELGDVGPSEFIPVAEDCGLIGEIGSWCLEETCRQIRAWEEAGLAIVPVSVNVSSLQFVDMDLQRVVSNALRNHGVAPSLLELELTESLLLEQGDDSQLTLRDLRAMGVRVALDDFGTGYSALTYLNRFELDVLKIDRDLLRDIDASGSAAGIVRAVVSMAHSLGLCVVAEGIDHPDQLDRLREMQCDQIQGFLFAPALPPAEASELMPRMGEAPPVVQPGSVTWGNRQAKSATDDVSPAPETSDDAADDLPMPSEGPAEKESRRILLIDDAKQDLGLLALRLGRLGLDVHYTAAMDEASLFVAQEGDLIRLLMIAPHTDLGIIQSVIDQLTREIGSRPIFFAVGDEPDAERKRELREVGVDRVLWAPFDDNELRYLIRSATTTPDALAERRDLRVPVDLVASLRAGSRREVVNISSLSTRGAFVEMLDPLPAESHLRLEMDLPNGRFVGFARVLYERDEDPDEPGEVRGIGVAFYGTDRRTDELLRQVVNEREARYVP